MAENLVDDDLASRTRWCDRCESAISALLDSSSAEPIGDIDALITGSHSCCPVCSIILAEVQESGIGSGKEVPQGSDTELQLKVTDRNTPMKIHITTVDNKTILGKLVVGLEDPGTPLSPVVIPHVVDSQTLFSHPHWSPENASTSPEQTTTWVVNHIAAWMEKCNAEHGEACNRGSETDLPTRLIRVDGLLRLVHTQELDATERATLSYASVSHVWGASQLLQLKTSNIDALRNNILPASLARKFQEIIALANAVGIRYVWIDTLCIMQDSREDWRREAGRMAAVYQNAVLNFAAVGSSATDVCLTSRNVLGLRRTGLTINHPSAGPITLYLSRSNGLVSRMFNLTRERPPVLTRGWIWQERFLARRTVYLGETQLAWECGRCLWLESTGFSDHFDDLAIWTFCKRTLTGAVPRNWHFLPDPHGDGKWKSHWENFIAAYTAAGLTQKSDKLIAVAGIARLFAQLSGATYVAGMWQEHIPWGTLLWKTDSRLPRPQAFRGAPSWSWASVDGELSYGATFTALPNGESSRRPFAIGVTHALHEPRTELVGLDVTPPDGPDAIFGEVKAAIVRVKGRLFTPDYALRDAGKKLSVSRLTTITSANATGEVFQGFQENDRGFDANFDGPVEQNGGAMQPPVVFCVLSTINSILDGLILSSCDENGLYRRVGMFKFQASKYARLQELGDVEETVVSIM